MSTNIDINTLVLILIASELAFIYIKMGSKD